MMNRRNENPHRKEQVRQLPGVAIRMRFFLSVAGPGMTAYPAISSSPTVYYGRMLKNVTFTETVGAQSLSYSTTDNYDYFFNLATEDYVEEGSVVLCFELGNQWYTIDKVKGQFVVFSSPYGQLDSDGDLTIRLFDGNLAAKKDGHTESVCVDVDDLHNQYHLTGRIFGNKYGGLAKRDKDGINQWTYSPNSGWGFYGLSVDRLYNLFGVQWDSGVGASVFKLNSSGTEQWETQYLDSGSGISGLGSIQSINLNEISCDRSGNTISTGTAGGHLGLGISSGLALYHDTDGVLQWYADASDYITHGSSPDIESSAFGSCAFTNSGDVYLAWGGNINPGGNETLFKFDSSGTLLWKREFGLAVTSLCLDSSENLYISYSTSTYHHLAKLAGGDPDSVSWDIATTFSSSNLLGRPIACDGKNPAWIYFAPSQPSVSPEYQGQRYDSTDGSLEESVELQDIIVGLVASPGRHPNFF